MTRTIKLAILSLLVCSVAIAQVFLDRLDVDNVRIDGNTISTTNSNGNLTVDLNGTGAVIFNDLTATTVPYLDGDKKLTSSAATPTQLGYLANASANLCGISQSCTLTNKTLTAPVLGGTITGTYTLGGTPTISSPTITSAALGIADGSSGSALGAYFTSDQNVGIWRSTTDTMEIVAGGYSGLQVKKSTGNYANLGMGGNASTSDNYPLLVERDLSTPGVLQLSNPNTGAGSGVKWQMSSSAGNNGGEMGLFAPATAAPDAYAGGNMTLRSTGTTAGISYIADDSGAYHKFYVGGNSSSEKIVSITSSGLVLHAGSIATVGTITSGTWNGTTIAIANGGTGQTSKTAAYDALSPNTTSGDISYYNGTDNVRLAKGSDGDVLTLASGAPSWAAPSAISNGTITGQSEDTSPAVDDLVITSDTSATALKKVQLSNIFKIINNFSADSSPDITSDYVATYDASASQPKRVLLQNLLLTAARSVGANPRIEWARVTPTNGSTCTVNSQSGSWISSTTANAAGDCTLNHSGIFSDAPFCTSTFQTGDTTLTNGYATRFHSTSTTAIRFQGMVDTGGGFGANANAQNIICIGTRP